MTNPLRYLDPRRWFDFGRRVVKLYRHDHSLSVPVMEQHLAEGCKRCVWLMEHYGND